MKAIVVTDQAARKAEMSLVERPEPPAAINDAIVQIHASGFVPTELEWPSTWTDRRDRTPSILGHELAGVVTALGYGTTGRRPKTQARHPVGLGRRLPLPGRLRQFLLHAEPDHRTLTFFQSAIASTDFV